MSKSALIFEKSYKSYCIAGGSVLRRSLATGILPTNPNLRCFLHLLLQFSKHVIFFSDDTFNSIVEKEQKPMFCFCFFRGFSSFDFEVLTWNYLLQTMKFFLVELEAQMYFLTPCARYLINYTCFFKSNSDHGNIVLSTTPFDSDSASMPANWYEFKSKETNLHIYSLACSIKHTKQFLQTNKCFLQI